MAISSKSASPLACCTASAPQSARRISQGELHAIFLPDAALVLDTIGGTTTEKSWFVLRRNGLLVTIVRQQLAEATPTGTRKDFVAELSAYRD